jgi:8-oxo-dGTP pyrophosphatase MutT (NUDIX family)
MSEETAGVPVRDAASVMLLRDTTDGLAVWVLERVAQMKFAAGMTVFPGGKVEAGDAALPWATGDARALASRLGCTETMARALVSAVIRETFEETGILLTRPVAGVDLAAHRERLEQSGLGFGDLLAEYGLSLDAGRLAPWSRWITPLGPPRRFDTRFFVAALPAGVEPSHVSSEAERAYWAPVEQLLAEYRGATRGMMPPTAANLTDLSALTTVDDALAAAGGRSLAPVELVVRKAADGATRLELPDGTVLHPPEAKGARR